MLGIFSPAEGEVSCLRMWRDDEWRVELEKHLEPARPRTVRSRLFRQMASW